MFDVFIYDKIIGKQNYKGVRAILKILVKILHPGHKSFLFVVFLWTNILKQSKL